MRKGGLYLAMGDSTTWTLPATSDPGWMLTASRIWTAINQNYGPCRHINKGIGGAGSWDFINLAYQRWATNLTPDLVTIQIGMNDCVNGSTAIATFQSNLQTMISLLRQRNPNVQIILCAPNTTTDTTRSPYVASYRTAMQTVAQGYTSGVGYCDFSQAWTSGQMATYSGDGQVHPNGAGHALLYNLLWPIVQTQAASWLATLGK